MADKLTLDRIDEMLRHVFKELIARGGKGRGRDVLAAIAPKLKLTPFELQTTKSGAVRWDTHVRFYTTDCTKAGYLQKEDGIWIITAAGEKALELEPGELIRSANRIYRHSKPAAKVDTPAERDADEIDEKAERLASVEQAKETAKAELESFLNDMDPYTFQDLVAELLRAMGYHIRSVAAKGPDGGIDIVGFKDPIGAGAPHIHVQVKHRDQAVTVQEVRELEGIIRRDSDIGLIVSSGGFTSDAVRELRASRKHIDTIDQDRLIQLWQEHYKSISEEGKRIFPLIPVFFLAPPGPG